MAKYVDVNKVDDYVEYTYIYVDDVEPVQVVSLQKTLANTPAADVEPVRHGHWCAGINEHCSECGEEIEYNDFYKYCPHCGARMDGDKSD